MPYTPEQLKIRRERAIAWNKAHPHRLKQNQKLYLLRNTEMIRSKANAYAKLHKEENTARLRAWRLANPWYDAWQAARQRCLNPKNPRYPRYGGRGIQFSLSKADMLFMWTRDKAAELHQPSLDRINNDGHYTLENCHFIPNADNARKRSLDNWKQKRLKENPDVDAGLL